MADKKQHDERTSQPKGDEKLSGKDMEQQRSEELPEREEMALVNANLALPINAAVAANVLSDGAIAYADAEQDAAMDQST